jgi:hypothetical protein
MSNKKHNLKEDKKSEIESLENKLKNQEKELQGVQATISLKKNELRSDTIGKQKASQAPQGTEAKNVVLPVLNKKVPELTNYIQTELTPQIAKIQNNINDTKKSISFVKSQPESEEGDKEEENKEESMKENKIIKASDFKSIVENYTKISLSESDIISILVETQNPVMTKSELIEGIQNKLIIEADMNRDVSGSFERGSNEYSELLGSDLAKQMANQSFDEIARTIRQKTGKQRVTFDDVQQLMSSSLMNVAKEEYAYGIDRLETKAVEMIRKQFNIPEGAVEFDVTITGVPQKALGLPSGTPQATIDQMSRQLGVKIGDIQREGLKFEKGNSPVPEGKTEEQMKPKIKRRKLTNAMMHGAARKSQNIHHMDDQLRQENPRLGQNYSNLMAANDASYWMMNDEDIQSQGRQGIHAGNVRVKLSSQPGGVPKIIAQGVVFPVLLHELAKGVIELMSLWSLPVDAEERKYVLDKTDTLADETNDIRLGPVIWEKFVAQIPSDNQEVISLTWNMMQELSDSDFNNIIEGLLNDRSDSQMKVKRMAEDAADELRRESSDDTFGIYGDEDEDEGEVAKPEGDNEDEGEYSDPELKRILGGQKGEEVPEETKDLNDMTDNELKSLMSSAIEDEDYEFASQIRDILNSRR